MLSNFVNKDGASQLEMEDSEEHDEASASPEMDERRPTDKSDMEMNDDGHDPLEGLPEQDG